MRDNFWGQLIIELREEQDISQRHLARSANICRSTLRRIELGTTPGDMDVMERIFGYLGYELEAMEKASIKRREEKKIIEVPPEQHGSLVKQRIMGLKLTLNTHVN